MVEMASTKKEVGGGARKTTRYPYLFPTLTSPLIVVLMLSSLCHNATSVNIFCFWDVDSNHNVIPRDNVTDIPMGFTYLSQNGYCMVVYLVEWVNYKGVKGQWIQEAYTYAIIPDGYMSTVACDAKKSCAMRSLWGDSDNVNFVCCCDTTKCNSPIWHPEMNPRLQYEKQLKANGSQACFVRFDQSAIQDCTRTTKQKETTTSPSRCLSVRKAVSGKQELGCAHDGTVDRCDWAMDQNGICRINWKTNDLECCCEGAYCNGDAYMNLTCRHALINSNHFNYGGGACAAPLPSTTSTELTTAQSSSTDSSAITTTDNDTDIWMIVALVCVPVLLLVFCALVFTCVVCCLQRKYLKQSGRNETIDDRSGVTATTSASECTSKSMTPSEKLDAEPPRIMIGEHEDEANVRAMGPQSNENSMTMAGVVSNWGSVHTVLPPPPQSS